MTSTLTPKQQARLDKAQRKALRPWYKKKRWYVLALLVVLVVFIATSIGSASKAVHVVTYKVTGTSPADVTYDTLQEGNGQQGEAQDTNVSLPWTKTIHASGLFTAYSLVATVGENGGTATCSIIVDGKTVDSNTATGAFATASCNS